jgi:competence protein ComEC
LFFAVGVLSGIYRLLPFGSVWNEVALALCFLLFLSFRWMPHSRLRKASGTLGLFAIALLGFLFVDVNTDSNSPDHLNHLAGKPAFYVARVASYAHEKENSWRLKASVEEVFVDGQWRTVSGNVFLYLSKRDRSAPYRYGDRLLIQGAPDRVTAPRNPGEFDYQRFLSFKNIFHQHFVLDRQIRWLSYEPANPVLAFAIRAREWSEQQLNSVIPAAREQAVANALVLGITDGLDNELTSAYAATGAMHVLAVSGLHVSIIYGLLLLVLKPFKRFRHGLAIQTVIALVVLWMYALVTGLSPSVLRAVTMFSFVVLARPFRQRTNIYNTLAAAAFCLLLYDPYLIMSVGFQLSFLAVLGIVYVQPLLYGWWEPKSYLVDQIWKISCVSIAAQLATFALGLLYFHQFPNYFLFSNLVVIPGSFGVLVGGLLALATAPLPILQHIVGTVLGWLIWLLNEFVLWVESWPYSLSDNWYINTFQCWTLLALVTCLVLMFQYRSVSWLYAAAACTVVFSVGNWLQFERERENDWLTVYHVNRLTAFDVISSGTAYQFMSVALRSDPAIIRFHITPNYLRTGVVRTNALDQYPAATLRNGVAWAVWKGQVIIHLQEKRFQLPVVKRIDWLIVSRQTLYDLTQLPSDLVVGCLIFDSSCPTAMVKKLTDQARIRGWRTHDVSQKALHIQL